MRIEKKGDWGSLIHDSNEMSQAVESQRQWIPRLRLYYSFIPSLTDQKENRGINDFLW